MFIFGQYLIDYMLGLNRVERINVCLDKTVSLKQIRTAFGDILPSKPIDVFKSRQKIILNIDNYKLDTNGVISSHDKKNTIKWNKKIVILNENMNYEELFRTFAVLWQYPELSIEPLDKQKKIYLKIKQASQEDKEMSQLLYQKYFPYNKLTLEDFLKKDAFKQHCFFEKK